MFVVGCGESENSLLKNKITCEEKGREYIKENYPDQNGLVVTSEFAYSQKLNTCIASVNLFVLEYPKMNFVGIYDTLTKKTIYETKFGYRENGEHYVCPQKEPTCLSPKEFDLKKEELFR